MKKLIKKFDSVDLFWVICILFAVLYQITVYGPLYEKNEKSFITLNDFERKIPLEISENEAYQKTYLNPNGLFSSIKNEKLSIIPDSIVKFANSNNDLIAFWAILSNYGEYNLANNPFGISNLETNKIDKNSSIVGSKNIYVDTLNRFIPVRVRFHSFENLQNAFTSFNENKDKFLISPKMKNDIDSIKVYLNSLNNKYKNIIDTNKLNIFKYDTISIDNSIKIASINKVFEYEEVSSINSLLIIFMTILICRLYLKKSNNLINN